jgi:hypothetical protein
MGAAAWTLRRIRWRLNDPAEEARQRWTKVHHVSIHADDLTACHIIIPEHPYMVDRDDQIPTGAALCKRCEHSDELNAPPLRCPVCGGSVTRIREGKQSHLVISRYPR